MSDAPQAAPRSLLSPAALAAVRPDAPPAERLAAARGEAALAAPDRLAAIAVLAADRDPAVREAARDRLAKGPAGPLLEGIEPATDPRILDILARARGADAAVADVLLRHPAVPDTALARLAVAAPGRLLAAVQDRQVPRPHRARIAAAMARAQEAADGPPAPAPPPPAAPAAPAPAAPSWAEISEAEAEALAARLAAGEDDPELAAFDAALTEETEEDLPDGSPKKENLYKQILAMTISEKIRLAFKGNKEARGLLVKDANRLVCGSVIKSPKLSETEVIAFANSRNLSSEVFRHIAADKEFTKLYPVKLALASNPRVPVDVAMRCLNQLHDTDVAALAKNRNVSSAVQTAARRVVQAKAEKQKKKDQALFGGGH